MILQAAAVGGCYLRGANDCYSCYSLYLRFPVAVEVCYLRVSYCHSHYRLLPKVFWLLKAVS